MLITEIAAIVIEISTMRFRNICKTLKLFNIILLLLTLAITASEPGPALFYQNESIDNIDSGDVPDCSDRLVQPYKWHVTLSYNVVQAFIDEHSLFIDYSFSKRHSLGFSIGTIFYNERFDPLLFSLSQNDYPGTVYKGYIVRITHSFYFLKRHEFDFYLLHQSVNQYVYYNNHDFYDGGKDNSNIRYTRSEKAFILGYDINANTAWYLNMVNNLYIFVNPFLGIGLRYRHRNIETSDIIDYNYQEYMHENPGVTMPVLGHELKKQVYLLLNIGLKFGFRI
ncbi:MAG TPA: hypothetical protein VHO70_20270 [Chitinispirillaceae bacterium]|nr:hypothetical protein [Chitinispirillaceae bacterium]